MVFKNREILTHSTTWMHLQDIMVSEISQAQKDERWTIRLIGGTQSCQICRDRKWNVGCQGLGEQGMRSCCFMGEMFQFCKIHGDEWARRLYNMNVLNATELYT